jgi:hypothetical protein
MESILRGTIYTHTLDNWEISWKSEGEYRHWCFQKHPQNSSLALVVMLNPGSLSRDGKNLKKDATLRILREVFNNTGLNPFIINLFDYATPSPKQLFQDWFKKDSNDFVYSHIKYLGFKGVVFAYGDYERIQDYGHEIKRRVNLIRAEFSSIPQIEVPLNKNGTPMHPMSWQRRKLKGAINQIISEFTK